MGHLMSLQDSSPPHLSSVCSAFRCNSSCLHFRVAAGDRMETAMRGAKGAVPALSHPRAHRFYRERPHWALSGKCLHSSHSRLMPPIALVTRGGGSTRPQAPGMVLGTPGLSTPWPLPRGQPDPLKGPTLKSKVPPWASLPRRLLLLRF